MCDDCYDEDPDGCAEYGHEFGVCDCGEEDCDEQSCVYCGEAY